MSEEQVQLTLVSDPTDEFPDNTNASFKTRLPVLLGLEGNGWNAALMALSIPNMTHEAVPPKEKPTLISSRWGFS